MSIRTGICKHCGESQDDHIFVEDVLACNPIRHSTLFTDSGLARLNEHAEELFEAVVEFEKTERSMGASSHDTIDAKRKMFSILQKIKSNP